MTNEEIIKALGIEGSLEEDKQSVLKNVTIVAEARFSEIIDEALNDEQAKSLNSEVEKNDPEAIAQWFAANMPEIGRLYEAVIREYVEELKDKLDQ